ncbi:ATP-binding protein [Nocardioides sp.]|uniref:ATP-binding protein n=1 Tax=Nocardioides sp. TaxID=35761 RepID=UPI002ED9EEC6
MHFALLEEIRQTHPLPYRGHGRDARRGASRDRVRGVGLAPHPAPADLAAELARERDRLHELRSTVSGLVASYHLLQEQQVELTSAARSRLEQLHRVELDRLERLLTDEAEDPAGPVDVGLAIDPLVETLRLDGHPIRWSGSRARAWGCHDDVAQVVHVLLDNAIQHAAGNEVDVVVGAGGGRVEVRVHDRGPGTYAADTGRRAGSPAVGLNTVHRLADQMGAVLRFEPGDVEDPGTTVVLSLPAHAEAAAETG